jgi:hypothetical protein
MPKRTPDWARLDPLIDRLRDKRFNDTQIARELGVARQTLVDHLRSREPVHLSTPKSPDTTEVHQSTPEHQGTLEGHQEVMEDVQQSVPEAPHISTEEPYQSTPEHQSVPQQPDSPEVHPSTPEVHQNMSAYDSHTAHSGVPARQEHSISTPMVHPGTPTAEDWQLWAVMKTRWEEVEKMLADWQTRHALLRTPSGTPRHTIKKTYVVDSLYIELIDRYAQEQGVELKDVVNRAFHEFFERRDYIPDDRRQRDGGI